MFQLVITLLIPFALISQLRAEVFIDHDMKMIVPDGVNKGQVQNEDGFQIVDKKDYVKNILAVLPSEEEYDELVEHDEIGKLLDIIGSKSALYALKRQPYRIFSSSFLHTNGVHFTLNAMSMSDLLTDPPSSDPIDLILVSFVSALSSSYSQAIGHPRSSGVGASGILFGIDGFLRAKHGVPIDAAAKSFVKASLLSEGIARALGAKIAHFAHLGGYITGLAYGFLSKSSFLPSNRSKNQGILAAIFCINLEMFRRYIISKNKPLFYMKYSSNPYPDAYAKLKALLESA